MISRFGETWSIRSRYGYQMRYVGFRVPKYLHFYHFFCRLAAKYHSATMCGAPRNFCLLNQNILHPFDLFPHPALSIYRQIILFASLKVKVAQLQRPHLATNSALGQVSLLIITPMRHPRRDRGTDSDRHIQSPMQYCNLHVTL